MKGMIIESIEKGQEIDNTKIREKENTIESIAKTDKETGIGTTETEIDKDTDKVKGIEKETEIDIIKIIKAEIRVQSFQFPTQVTCQTIVFNVIVRLGLHDTSFNECLRTSWVTLSFRIKC